MATPCFTELRHVQGNHDHELVQRRPRPVLDFWIDHGTGVWLCVSPLLLGYPGLLPASMSMLVAGVITLALREQEHGWDEGHVPHR